MTAEDEQRAALERIGQALDALGVQWAIGGSFASTIYGEPRATNDIDVVANLRAEHVTRFIATLGSDFYADEPMIRDAISARDSFNVIDERSVLKIDVFVPPPGPLGEGQLLRRRTLPLGEAGPSVFVLSPEDTILQKLRWFALGGQVSDRQWRDIVGVARLAPDLDVTYLQDTATAAGLADLLGRALAEAKRV